MTAVPEELRFLSRAIGRSAGTTTRTSVPRLTRARHAPGRSSLRLKRVESCLRREAWAARSLRSHRTWGSRECDHPESTHGDYTDGFEPVFWCDHCGATAVGYADGEPDWEHATWPEED